MKDWTPAVDFTRCYLSAYEGGKTSCVFISREAYWLMGKPKRLVVMVGDVIALSPAVKYGVPVKVDHTGQPYVVHKGLWRRIGPGNRVVYDYDETRQYSTRRYEIVKLHYTPRRTWFYFRKEKKGVFAPFFRK
jgi:hypothetical protein